MRRKRLSKLEFLLAVLVVLLFVGGYFFVVYEPGMIPALSKPPAESRNVPVLPVRKSRPAAVKPKAVKTVAKVKAAVPDKVVPPPAAAKAAEVIAPAASDFGIEGMVFSLVGGLPVNACIVSFNGENLITGQTGDFHLGLDGAAGRLSFSCAGFKPLEISRFDPRAGDGLAHFDVYLSAVEAPGAGRIEVNGVSGRVYDRRSGAPLAGAVISVGGRRGVADDAGFFEIWGNNSGLMTMTVAASGYVSEMLSGIDFENRDNPFFFEVSLERNQEGKGRLALVGIGARLVKSEAGYEIADVLHDSPAEREGLLPGDRLVAVDSLAVDDFSLPEVVELIRGQAGLPVTLMVEREGDFLEFICQRQRVVY
ncbi:MAG: PDZ domain-containing protein [Deltaproteobacteria bacterium]|nr:PDZ domain-containing protein [Deltaproteobacteria bacterium]